MQVLNHALKSLKQSIPYRRLSRQQRWRRLRKQIQASHQLKVLIGAGPTSFPGWIQTDKDLLDITSAEGWRRLFKPSSIDRLLAEHVLEHLSEAECRTALSESRRYLKPEGMFRIAVPDGFHPDPNYIEAVRPGGTGPDSDSHKALYNYRTLNRIANEEGFTCELLEYFDEQRLFHRIDWNLEDGFIERSERYDARNKEGRLTYTSLIVDLHPRAHLGTQMGEAICEPPQPHA